MLINFSLHVWSFGWHIVSFGVTLYEFQSSMIAYIGDGAGGCVYHVDIEHRGLREYALWKLPCP